MMMNLLWKATCRALAMELAMARFARPARRSIVFADRLLLEVAALERDRETQGLLESALAAVPCGGGRQNF